MKLDLVRVPSEVVSLDYRQSLRAIYPFQYVNGDIRDWFDSEGRYLGLREDGVGVRFADGLLGKGAIVPSMSESSHWLRDFPLAEVISVGLCHGSGVRVAEGIPFSIVAHAHPRIRKRGLSHNTTPTICFFISSEWSADGPTEVFLHEYAHLMSPGVWPAHSLMWKNAFRHLTAGKCTRRCTRDLRMKMSECRKRTS